MEQWKESEARDGRAAAVREMDDDQWSRETAERYFETLSPLTPDRAQFHYDRAYCAAIAERFGVTSPYDRVA